MKFQFWLNDAAKFNANKFTINNRSCISTRHNFKAAWTLFKKSVADRPVRVR
jgi:hypothetical protein